MNRYRPTPSRRLLAGAVLVALALAGCGSDDGAEEPAASGGGYASLSGTLLGSGASFPEAFYQAAIIDFRKVAPDVMVNYNATGSGTGKRQFAEGLVAFAGTDSLVKDDEAVTPDSFLYFPTVAAPITVPYNLSGVDDLRLGPTTLAKIFQTEITTWNHPEIRADNPGIALPATRITVAHRSDGSGTTNNFTRYLAAASPAWRLGSGDTVAWPATTQGGTKNTGVAQIVKQTEGAIGYVDLSDARALGLHYAAIKNRDGQFVEPTLEAATAALEGAEVKEDLSYNPLNASGAVAYPITAPTYVLARKQYEDPGTAELVKGFLRYLLTDAQATARQVDFAPLPPSLADRAVAQLDRIRA